MTGFNSQPLPMKTRWLWFIVLSLFMVAIDQWMKWYAMAYWRELPPRSFLYDTFRISYAENDGAFLGLFGNLPDAARFWILTVFNGLILAGVAGYILGAKNVSRYVFLAFALVVAGGIGNMIDRVRFGVVIDFFNIGIGGLRSGIFNIADMSISAGFLMMVPLAILGEKESPQESVDPTPGTASS